MRLGVPITAVGTNPTQKKMKWDDLWLTLPSPAGLIYHKTPDQKRVGEWLEALLPARTETLFAVECPRVVGCCGFLSQNNEDCLGPKDFELGCG
jgi:hypothetical protein